MAMSCCIAKDPMKLLPYEAYYKYSTLNRLMRYLAISLGLLKSYEKVGDGFRFDAFEPFRDALLQTYLLAQNLLERSQKLDLCCNTVDRVQSNGDAVAKEEQLMLCNEERHRLLMCVQNLAGCVEFSGVGNEKSYLAMCTNALNLLSEVQKDFHQKRFVMPKWMQEKQEKIKNDWKKFEEELSKEPDPSESQKKLQTRVDDKYKELLGCIEKELDREIACTPGEDEKAKKLAARPTTADIKKMIDDEMENDQNKKDAAIASLPKDELLKKYMERAKEREVARILFFRQWKLKKEKEWLEKSKTARASEPVLYRSNGPNSYSASRRPKSPNAYQREVDPMPWSAWQMEKSQFLLSASRSVGVLRSSIKSKGFRFDAFQPFFGALRDTFNLCDKHLKRNELDEEYLSVSERNTLLAAIVGLAGCVTFTGVSQEGKYDELCEIALDKLQRVVDKLSGVVDSNGASQQQQLQQQQQLLQQQQQLQQLQQQQQQFGYFNRQTTPQQQYAQFGGGYHSSVDYWNRGDGGQASGYYGLIQTPVPWPGQMYSTYTAQTQLQPAPQGHP